MMRRLVILGCVLAMAGCDGGGGTDAGMDSGGDTDAGMMAGAEALQVVTARDPDGTPTAFGTPNWACDPTAPTGMGAPIAFDLVAESFGAPGSPTIEGLTVQFFADNTVPVSATCGAGCTEITTGADGSASVMDVEGSWYAYRVPGGMGNVMGAPTMFVPVTQYNEVAPAAGGSQNINAVAMGTQNTIILLLGRTQETGTGVVTGILADCDGNEVVNARVRVFDASGEIPLNAPRTGQDTEPFEFYFNGMQFPAQTQTDTNTDGLYGVGNIPVPGDNVVRIGLYGAATDDGPMELLACEEIQVNAGGITILNVGPQRSDGSQDCPE